MSRLFDDGSGEYLEAETAILTALPITMAGWFNANAINVDQAIVALSDPDADTYLALLAAGNIASDPVRAVSVVAGTMRSATTSTGFTANTWYHAAGVFLSSTSRSAYINGGSKATNTVSSSITGLKRTGIGRQGSATAGTYMSGSIAEVGIWDIALTDAEIAILALGYSPVFVRPGNLVAYWPVIGRTSVEVDIVGGLELEPLGTVVSTHPRIKYPRGARLGVPTAVASGHAAIRRFGKFPYIRPLNIGVKNVEVF